MPTLLRLRELYVAYSRSWQVTGRTGIWTKVCLRSKLCLWTLTRPCFLGRLDFGVSHPRGTNEYNLDTSLCLRRAFGWSCKDYLLGWLSAQICLAVWASLTPSLGLSFPICKMESLGLLLSKTFPCSASGKSPTSEGPLGAAFSAAKMETVFWAVFSPFLTDQRSVASRGFYFYLWTIVTLPEGGWAAEQGTAWLPCFRYRAHLLPAHSDT